MTEQTLIDTARRFHRVARTKPGTPERAELLAAWQAMTHENIASARTSLSNTLSVRFIERWLWKQPFTFLFAGWLSTIGHMGYYEGAWLTGAGVGLVTGGALAIMMLILCGALDAMLSGNQTLRDGLIPVSEAPHRCSGVIEVLKKHPELAGYRDAVVASGRGLTGLDIDYIHCRADELFWEQYREEQAAACRQLHGIEPTEEAAPAAA